MPSSSTLVIGLAWFSLISYLARQTVHGVADSHAEECCLALGKVLPGQVFWPSSETYRAQQSTYYSAEQSALTPACRVSPASTADVSGILKLAHDMKCHFAVRTGGHMSWSGASNIGPTGMTIDMQELKRVELSDDKTVVSIASGARWRNVYSVLKPQNLTTAGGRVGDVGVAGFLLGGGIGFLSAERGFGSDSVVNYEIVLADGTVLNANAKDHSDLYWALKLGSTNFGIVTRFDMTTFAQGQVWGGSQFFAISDAPALLERLVTFTSKLAEDPKGFFGLSLAWNPASKDYIIWTLQTYLKPEPYPPLWSDFASLTPLVDLMGMKNLMDITEEFQEADPGKHGRSQWLSMTYKANAQFHLDLHVKGIELFEPYHDHPGVHWAVSVQPIPSGFSAAAARNGGNPSGLSVNDGDLWVMLITTDWLDPADDEAMKSNCKTLLKWAEDEAKKRGIFSPYIYMNYATEAQNIYERSTNKATLSRMHDVKKAYDPRNVLDEIWHGGFKLPSAERDRSEL